MDEIVLKIEDYKNIEEWLKSQDEYLFPAYYPEKGEKSYPEKYLDLKNALIPYHKNVESGALLQSVNEWKQGINDQLCALSGSSECDICDQIKQLEDVVQQDPVIYLNQHGTGHVEKVIEKVIEIIKKFRFDRPSPSEIFVLLCAIQIHDIGNIFGRKGHEKSFQTIFRDVAKDIIPDTVTQRIILKIAQVHSGNINGDKDTISRAGLRIDGTWFNKVIREPVLAALLRFGDELADDSSRYDKTAFDLESIPKESIIYHAYSKCLHAVNIFNNEVNKTCYLSLEYYVDSNAVTNEYTKENQSILLIDEIFYRTKKMEQERRYCMRFLAPYLPLTEIKVRIEIESEFDLTQSEVITYSLKEDGYPTNEIVIDCNQNTGEKVKEFLKGKGWRL
ncbi:hypothetical protein FRZ06_08000 [Anoxybacterium hadale]|uniref:Uncharacterized protein n=1 Tax=Anoxybacterium hadale TaxID=3408580 RepID=A0ACD1AAE6_9FIRM|nr:hypothetical protein FRZ06_08000 [Clostridiales bacterium]